MSTDPPPTPPSTRKWWCALIATTLLGPFLPTIGAEIGGLSNAAGAHDEWQGAILGLILWMSAVVVSSAMLGWRINARRDTEARLRLTVLFIFAAIAVSLSWGYPVCNFIKI